MTEPTTLIPLRNNDPILARMQEEIWAIVTDERYENVSTASTVGVLEFVKFNVINGSER